jgi:hypothetical protein
VLKGPYTAIAASVIVHVALLLTLIFTSVKEAKLPKEDKPKTVAIKSFLYTAPKKSPKRIIEKIEPLPEPIKKVEAVTPKKVLSKPKKRPTKPTLVKEVPLKSSPKVATQKATESEKTRTAEISEKAPSLSPKKSQAKTNYTDIYGLSRLRKKLDKQNRDQAFTDLTQKRSASVMDGEPFAVPEAVIPLTEEQKYKQNTNTNHTGSITKNDNGTCTQHREQVLGSPVPATTSYFACGESKFDKGFREHMKKVQVKLAAPKK